MSEAHKPHSAHLEIVRAAFEKLGWNMTPVNALEEQYEGEKAKNAKLSALIIKQEGQYRDEKRGLLEQLEARDRWAGFTHRETQDMHHALRMFAKFPGLSHEDQAGYTALADEIWNRHAAQVAALNPASEPEGTNAA